MQKEIEPCGTLAPVFVQHVELCRRWAAETMEYLKDGEYVFDGRVEEVENRSRSGFIPFTDGGFDAVGYTDLNSCHGSGATPDVVQPYLDRILKDAEKDWDTENPEHTVAWICADVPEEPLLPGIEPNRVRDQWREKWYEFESAQLTDGCTFFYKVRVLFHGDEHRSESGEPEAYFMVGINTDFEYGRDSIPWLSCYGQKTQQTTWLWEKTIKVAELTDEMIDIFVTEATDAFAKA